MITLFQRWMDRERSPARIKAELAADLLGFQPDDMAVLALNEILVPLGNPTANAVKYYATVDVVRIPMKADTCSDSYRTLIRRYRTVVGAKRRSAVSNNELSDMRQENRA